MVSLPRNQMSALVSSSTSKVSGPPSSAPWVEKYRPKKLDDVAAQDHTVAILKRTMQSNNLPHMLFYGPPGTGKTSTILALAKELYGPELIRSRVLELNASDERGISIVREKVKNFARIAISKPSEEARKNYPCPPYKLIILDEADSMTADAQSALRRTMENYSKITRFCLICNYVTRIIDPLASRCSKFRFKSLDASNALQRLEYISQNEELNIEPEALIKLLDVSGGDLRRAITLLQSSARLHKAPGSTPRITAGTINEVSGTVPSTTVDELIGTARNGTVKDVQAKVNDLVHAGWSATQLIVQLHDDLILKDQLLSSNQKSDIAMVLSEVDKDLVDGSDEHLQILTLMLQVSGIMKST